jgi:hypothetical protein
MTSQHEKVRIMVHTDWSRITGNTTGGWMGEVIVEADTWKGPYKMISSRDITDCIKCEEDPFMWKDHRGNWHVRTSSLSSSQSPLATTVRNHALRYGALPSLAAKPPLATTVRGGIGMWHDALTSHPLQLLTHALRYGALPSLAAKPP